MRSMRGDYGRRFWLAEAEPLWLDVPEAGR